MKLCENLKLYNTQLHNIEIFIHVYQQQTLLINLF